MIFVVVCSLFFAQVLSQLLTVTCTDANLGAACGDNAACAADGSPAQYFCRYLTVCAAATAQQNCGRVGLGYKCIEGTCRPPATTAATTTARPLCDCPAGASPFDALVCTDLQVKQRTATCERCATCIASNVNPGTTAAATTARPLCDCPAGASPFDGLVCTDLQVKTRTSVCERCATCVASNVHSTAATTARPLCECPAGASPFDGLVCADGSVKTRTSVCDRCATCVASNGNPGTTAATTARPVACECPAGASAFDGLVCADGSVKTRTSACERCATCVKPNVNPATDATRDSPVVTESRAACECPDGATPFDSLSCTDAQTKTRTAVCERCAKCVDKSNATEKPTPTECVCADGARKFDALTCEAGSVKARATTGCLQCARCVAGDAPKPTDKSVKVVVTTTNTADITAATIQDKIKAAGLDATCTAGSDSHQITCDVKSTTDNMTTNDVSRKTTDVLAKEDSVSEVAIVTNDVMDSTDVSSATSVVASLVAVAIAVVSTL